MKLVINYLVPIAAGGLLWISGYLIGADFATRKVESRINAEHQQAIEDAIVCKLSLALTQERLQRFEQVELKQLQSCCADE